MNQLPIIPSLSDIPEKDGGTILTTLGTQRSKIGSALSAAVLSATPVSAQDSGEYSAEAGAEISTEGGAKSSAESNVKASEEYDDERHVLLQIEEPFVKPKEHGDEFTTARFALYAKLSGFKFGPELSTSQLSAPSLCETKQGNDTVYRCTGGSHAFHSLGLGVGYMLPIWGGLGIEGAGRASYAFSNFNVHDGYSLGASLSAFYSLSHVSRGKLPIGFKFGGEYGYYHHLLTSQSFEKEPYNFSGLYPVAGVYGEF